MTSPCIVHADDSNMRQFTELYDHHKYIEHFVAQLAGLRIVLYIQPPVVIVLFIRSVSVYGSRNRQAERVEPALIICLTGIYENNYPCYSRRL